MICAIDTIISRHIGSILQEIYKAKMYTAILARCNNYIKISFFSHRPSDVHYRDSGYAR